MQISDLVIVCPDNIQTLKNIKNKNIVINTTNLSNISNILKVVSENNNKLNGIRVYTEFLDTLNFEIELPDTEIAVYVKRIGSYSVFRKQIEALKNKNIRFFFPANTTESFIDAKIISTIGLSAGIDINSTEVQWQDLIDLTIHSIYSRAQHTVIQPIKFFLENYKVADVNVQAIYFNDESHFIHADENLNFALSDSDLKNKKFIAKGFEELHSEAASKKYLDHVSQWHEHFIKHTKCSVCKAWKMCQGQFESVCTSGNEEPVEFYSEILTALEMSAHGQKINLN